MVKLLNETQNILASDLSDWKILITLEWGPFSLDIWEMERPLNGKRPLSKLNETFKRLLETWEFHVRMAEFIPEDV